MTPSARHNNARLRAFLDQFGFDYEFMSSTDSYTAGRVRRDAAQDARALRRGDGDHAADAAARSARATYSPFLPIHPEDPRRHAGADRGARRRGRHHHLERPRDRRALRHAGHRRPRQAAVEARLGDALGRARRRLRDGRQGPDRLGQGLLGDRRALDAAPPEGFNYELFLDEQGQKISKSKGNGLTIDEWLTYASPESLALYMFQRPREAKKLHFDVIPRAVDEYLQFLGGYERQDWKNRLGNPVWHIHAGEPPAAGADRHRRRRQRGPDADHLRPADEPRRRRQFRGQGRALGLPAALCARRSRQRPIRASMRWSATPSPISATS